MSDIIASTLLLAKATQAHNIRSEYIVRCAGTAYIEYADE